MELIQNGTEMTIREIEGSWNKTVESLLVTAQLLLACQKRSDWFQIKAELSTRKIMQTEVLSMMMSIGRNKLLNQQDYLKQLPRSYNSLYHLSKMDSTVLKEKLKAGEITSSIRLVDVRMLTAGLKKKIIPTKKKTISKHHIKTISMSLYAYEKHKDVVDALFRDIAIKHPYLKVK